MGGAEKWMKGIAEETGKFEETYVIDDVPEIADLYGRLVLKRRFHANNTINSQKIKRISLTKTYFNPFSDEYKQMKKIFKTARIVYIKFEVMEVFISMYFGGKNIFKKIIAGIHSPLFYQKPMSFFNFLHNFVYSSVLYKFFISKTKKIHVLHERDKLFLIKKFNLDNIIQMYDGVDMMKNEDIKETQNKNELKIISVGELSLRKGTDIVCKIIKNAPQHFSFSIVGDGPKKDDVKKLINIYNCQFYGFISDENKLKTLYKSHDVLLFPSRAECLALAMVEAMNYGLKIVNAKEVALGVPDYIESPSQTENPSEYIELLCNVLQEKINGKINRNKIHEYAYNNFSNDIVYPKFLKEVFNIQKI